MRSAASAGERRAVGQSTTQTIQGLVTDPSGAVIPGANVTMRNLGTGVTQVVQSNETGNYTFAFVPVGNYEVRCEAAGFKTDLVGGVRVETGAQVRPTATPAMAF